MAQVKVGYTNVDYILSLMPQAKQIESELSTTESQYTAQLEAKYQDFQAKLAQYQQTQTGLSDVDRADKEKELQDLQVSIQQYESNAQNSLLNKRNEMLQPLYEQIGNAIEQVSKENAYSHVFNMSAGGQSILLYAREEDNVTNLILAKLGIDPPASSRN